MQKTKFLFPFLIVLLVLTLIPFPQVHANPDTPSLMIDLNKPYFYMKGETIMIYGFSNMTVTLRLEVYWNWKTFSENELIYNNTKTSNATWNLPTTTAQPGYYRFVLSSQNETTETWRTLIHTKSYLGASLPFSYTWKGINYTFEGRSLNATFRDDFLTITYPVIPYPYSASIFYNNMSFLIRLTGNNWDVDISYFTISMGLKWILNGTIPTDKKFDFQCSNNPSTIWKPLLHEFKSLNAYLTFTWSDLALENEEFVFNSTTKILTVTIPDNGSFSIDPYIFQDGFETGDFTAWTDQTGTPAVVASNPHHGTYSCRINAAYQATSKDITAISTAYMRFYLRWNTQPASAEIYTLGGLYSATNYYLAALLLKEASGSYYWGLEFRKSGAAQQVFEASASNPSVDTYYCAEVKFVAETANGAALWIDGNLKIDATGYTTQNTNVDRGRLRFMTTGSTAPTINYDCAVIDIAYIGVESTATSKTFQGNFAPAFTLSFTRTWTFTSYRTMPVAFALNHWNTYSFSNLHTFSVSFGSSLNRFVGLNTINQFGIAFSLENLRAWQFTTYRTIPLAFTINSIFSYTAAGFLTFYGDIATSFTLNMLKQVGFTREQTIPFSFTIQSTTSLVQLGIITIYGSIGLIFQTLSTQYGLAEITLDATFAIAGLALVLAIALPLAFFMLYKRDRD